MIQMPTGGYVRHRNRMVQESVFQDLQNALIACRWMTGTTSRTVIDPMNPGAGWTSITVDTDDVLKLVGTLEDDSTVAQLKLIDFFPEAGGNDDKKGKTDKNTFAIDQGEAQDPEYIELGSNFQEQQYVFTMAFYASSDAVAMAVLNDLKDRYEGRIISDDHVDLFDYNDPSYDENTPPVARMEVETFRFKMDAETVSPWEVHLYFAELTINDLVDAQSATSVPGGGFRQLTVVTGHGPPTEDIQADVYIDEDTGNIYGQ